MEDETDHMKAERVHDAQTVRFFTLSTGRLSYGMNNRGAASGLSGRRAQLSPYSYFWSVVLISVYRKTSCVRLCRRTQLARNSALTACIKERRKASQE